MSRQKTERAYGPYTHGARWRVVIVRADGTRGHRSFESFEEGKEYVDAFASVSNSRSVGQAVEAFLADIATDNELTNKASRHRVCAILRVAEGDRLLTSVSPNVAQGLYRRRCEEVVAATHHNELSYAKRFFAWCVKRGWLRHNPFETVEAVGVRNRGKPKLRINDSRKYLEAALAEDSADVTAVLVAFLLGMRAGEIIKLRVRDLDDNGRLIWITDAKTAAGDREIEVPELLRVRMLPLCEGKGPDDRIFHTLTRHTLLHHVTRLCEVAGVPRVTPHGLRGSAATKEVRMGRSVEDVAQAVGHADKGKTLRAHYLGGGAEESARGKKMIELLVPREEKADDAELN